MSVLLLASPVLLLKIYLSISVMLLLLVALLSGLVVVLAMETEWDVAGLLLLVVLVVLLFFLTMAFLLTFSFLIDYFRYCYLDWLLQ